MFRTIVELFRDWRHRFRYWRIDVHHESIERLMKLRDDVVQPIEIRLDAAKMISDREKKIERYRQKLGFRQTVLA